MAPACVARPNGEAESDLIAEGLWSAVLTGCFTFEEHARFMQLVAQHVRA